MQRVIEPYDDHSELKKEPLDARWVRLRQKMFGSPTTPEFDLENKVMQ